MHLFWLLRDRPMRRSNQYNNTIGLGLPMFINATTRQQISIYSIGPYLYLLVCTPHIWKSGCTKNIFAGSARESCFVPHLNIRGAAHAHCQSFSIQRTVLRTGCKMLIFVHWLTEIPAVAASRHPAGKKILPLDVETPAFWSVWHQRDYTFDLLTSKRPRKLRDYACI